jgi:hypothetical protein
MLHSGSRGAGNRIGSYFIELAKQDMRKLFVNLPDEDLAYFPEGTEHFNDYFQAVGWAQDYARANRDLLMLQVVDAVRNSGEVPPFNAEVQAINCHHNYVTGETHYGEDVLVTRKGAVRAREGDLGIIPGSMGARSFIVRGKGNPDSFNSCSHGAGRNQPLVQQQHMIEALAPPLGVENLHAAGVPMHGGDASAEPQPIPQPPHDRQHIGPAAARHRAPLRALPLQQAMIVEEGNETGRRKLQHLGGRGGPDGRAHGHEIVIAQAGGESVSI